jgi:hypothetical protein
MRRHGQGVALLEPDQPRGRRYLREALPEETKLRKTQMRPQVLYRPQPCLHARLRENFVLWTTQVSSLNIISLFKYYNERHFGCQSPYLSSDRRQIKTC